MQFRENIELPFLTVMSLLGSFKELDKGVIRLEL